MKAFWKLAKEKLEEYLENTNKIISIYNINNVTKKAKELKFKIKNYKKWIQETVEFQTKNIQVKTEEDLKNLGIKGSLLSKLKEILSNGEISDNLKLLELISKNSSPELNKDTEEITKLTSIHDVGTATAKKLYEKGVSLDKLLEEWKQLVESNSEIANINFMKGELQQKVPKERIKDLSKIYRLRKEKILNMFSKTKYLKHLTYYQIVALKYYEDIKQRIDRSEIRDGKMDHRPLVSIN